MKYYKKYADYWSKRNELIDVYWNDEDLIRHSKRLASRLSRYDFSSVYEIGLYCGRNLKYIHDRFPEVKIGGCDVNRSALNYARENLPPNTVLENIDVLNMDTDDKWDIVFTHGVLMHIPPDGISLVLDKCLEKANKYVVHMERQESDNHILRGAEEMKPEMVSVEFRWAPNISDMYRAKGCNIIYKKNKRVGISEKLQTILVIKK